VTAATNAAESFLSARVAARKAGGAMNKELDGLA
jgi:hypothetical protein